MKTTAIAVAVLALLVFLGFVGKRLTEHKRAVDKCVTIFMRDYDSATVARRQGIDRPTFKSIGRKICQRAYNEGSLGRNGYMDSEEARRLTLQAVREYRAKR